MSNRQCLFKGLTEDHGRIHDSSVEAWVEATATFRKLKMFDGVDLIPGGGYEVPVELHNEWASRFNKSQQARFRRVQEANPDGVEDSFEVRMTECFVKAENTQSKSDPFDVTDVDSRLVASQRIEDVDPRCISNGTPEQQVMNGVWWWLVGLLMKKVFNKNSWVTYAGGLVAQDMVDIFDKVNRDWPGFLTVWTDCSRFDGRITPAALKAEREIFSDIEAFPEKLLKFMENDDVTHGKSRDGSVNYRVMGSRKSGRNDTSAGNSVLNASGHLSALVRMGIPIELIIWGVKMVFIRLLS